MWFLSQVTGSELLLYLEMTSKGNPHIVVQISPVTCHTEVLLLKRSYKRQVSFKYECLDEFEVKQKGHD